MTPRPRIHNDDEDLAGRLDRELKVRIEAVEGHGFVKRTSISGPAQCQCGWEQAVQLGRSVTEAWAEHVAVVIRTALEQGYNAEAVRLRMNQETLRSRRPLDGGVS